MKTKILTIAMSTLLTTNTFANFKVIISSEANNYNYGEKVVIVGEWLATEEKSCSKDNLAEDYYYGIEFDQTETCSEPQERITTTKVVYSDGREEIINKTKETKIDVKSNTIKLTGTHIENTCEEVLSNGFSYGDGNYRINFNGGSDVYCDMTRNGGGWMRITNYNFVENPDNTPNGFVKTVNRTLTTYTGASFTLKDGWYRKDVTSADASSFIWEEIIAPTNNFAWTESMIDIDSLQAITPDSYNVATSSRDSTTVNGQYLDGISITYGIQGNRKHIHSLTRTTTGLTRAGLEWLANSGDYTATEIAANNQRKLTILSGKVPETTENISARFALNQLYNDEKIGFTKLVIWIK